MSKTFKVGEKEYRINEPSLRVENEAQKIYNKKMQAAIDDGAFLKEQMGEFLKEKNLWDANKEAEITKKAAELRDGLDKLDKKGMNIKEAIELAKKCYLLRMEIIGLSSYKTQYNYLTAENQSETDRFAYILSECLVYNDTGEKVFKSYEDLLGSNDKELFEEASDHLTDILYGDVLERLQQTEENQFLEKYKKYDTESQEQEAEQEESEKATFFDDDGNPIE